MASLLILEDNTAFAGLLSELIGRTTRLIPIRTTRLEEAVRVLREGVPVGVVTDLLLPDAAGLDVLTGLRRESGAPLFVMSGIFRGGHLQRIAASVDVAGWFEKPFDLRLLVEAVRPLASSEEESDMEFDIDIDLSDWALLHSRRVRRRVSRPRHSS